MPIPKATEVNLSAEEQEGLEQLVRRHNVGQQIGIARSHYFIGRRRANQQRHSSAIWDQHQHGANAGAIVGQKHKRYPTRI